MIRVGHIPPFHDMTYQALYRLSPGEWLNDDIVTTGLRYALLFRVLRWLTSFQRLMSKFAVGWKANT